MEALDHNGHRLMYVDRGRGQPVVFVHNAALSHRLWDHQISHFERTRRVIAPDLLGLGRSDRPDIVYTAEDYVTQLERLADHLELDRFDLVGCCLGGGIALEFARRHPDRVRSLGVITATTPRTIASGIFGPFEAVSEPGSRLRTLIWQWCETGIGRWVMSQAFYRAQCGPVALADTAFREHVRRMYHHDGQWRVFCSTSYAGFATLDEFTKPPGFPPTLIMWGGRNRILRAAAGAELAAAIEPQRTEFWPDCGYMLMRERPAETNRVLAELMASADGAAARDEPALPAGDGTG